MNLPELSIRRPVMTTLVMAGILVFGILSYRALPVSELPNVDFPTIAVAASLPGANPETMASSVATPLEAQFATIPGLDSMSSTSALGTTQITLQFALDRNIDAAAQDVQAAISAALLRLPTNLPNPPTYRKVNPADFPVLYIAMTSTTLPLSTVDDYAETMLAQRLSTVKGVAQVQVFGSQKYAVRVQVDPQALATRGIGIDEVSRAVQAGNVNMPTGAFNGPHRLTTINATGQLLKAENFRPLIVTYRNGAPVRLEQLGRVIDSVENDKTAGWLNNQRAIVLAIQRQPGSNTVETVDGVKKVLPRFMTTLPASIDLRVLYDRSESIRASVNDVQFTLMLAAFLVVLVIFLFLRTATATVIPSLALPFSIIGTFAVMYIMGFTIDNLSLLALTLSVGFVVDDAIVMLENIFRHMERGESPLQAALAGSREISFTIVSMTLSLAAVFIPLLFMGGIVGRLLHEFAVTIVSAIFVSGFVSLTLTPMLASRFVHVTHAGQGTQHGRIYRASERAFEAMRDAYDRSLRWSLARGPLMILIFVLTLVATAYLFWIVPKGFLPSEDTGQLVAFTQGPPDASFDYMTRHQQAIGEVIARDPNVASYMSFVGAGGARTTGNLGLMFLRLKPRNERPLRADDIIQELRPKLAPIPGIRAFLQNPPPIRIGGMLTQAQYQYTLTDTNLQELYHWAGIFEQELRKLAGFQDVASDLNLNAMTVNIEINRNQAATLGVTPEQIESALGGAFASQQISTIYTPTTQYQVILEVVPEFQRDPAALSDLYVRADTGKLVPLRAFARITPGSQALSVAHQGQLPSATLSFNLAPGTSLGQAVDRIHRLAGELGMPSSVSGSVQGAAQAFQSSLQGLGMLLIVAILVVYIVLGILYESFVHPLTILSGLPSAGVGALLTLLIFDVDLNLYAFVGIIMLIGIVKKNAIMMIDFALAGQRREGKEPRTAIYEAALTRFRPIMMTTFAALMGTLPIAVGFGAGAESRRPLGLAVVGGLLVSQFLTLYLTPVIYLYLEQAKQLDWRRYMRKR